MDTVTAIIIITALFALIVVAGFIVYRQRSSVDIDTPLGKLKMESSNDPPRQPSGVLIEDAKSRAGGIVAEDKTESGATVRRAEAEKDIKATSQRPDNPADPKA
jgi:FtsZ-interacting cell division protein ZipA